MKKILITGANGFIGRNLAEYLDTEYNVVAISRKEADLLDQRQVEKLFQKEDIDVVIHAATQGTLGRGKEYEQALLKNNLSMFFHLERCHAAYGKLIVLGSGAEYGKERELSLVEEETFDTVIPGDNYGFSKYIMSKAILNSNNIYNLRLFGIFGPYENYNYRFISNIICKALLKNKIVIHQNVVFDYLYIKDFCRAIPWFVEHKLKRRCYNVCTGKPQDIVSLAREIVNQIGNKCEIEIEIPGWNQEYTGSNRRWLEEMGTFEFTPMEQAIAELIEYYKKTPFCLEGDY